MKDILLVNHLTKKFKSSDKELTVLKDVNFSLREGEGISIVGPSGCGKTTLLGLCAGLDQPSDGSVTLMDMPLNRMDEDDRAFLRNQYVGFIFQNFHLLPTINALENVMIPLEIRGGKNIKDKAMSLLERVGLKERMEHYPTQLSGGELQRVAIARAFITEPKILFADEPTGNLDEETSDIIAELMFQINEEQQTTLVLVTHDHQLAKHTGRVLKLEKGMLIEDKLV